MSSLRPGRAGVRARRRGTPNPLHPPRPAPPGSRHARARTKPTHDERARGQSLVELALVTPVLLLLLLGAIDLGRLFYAQITVTNAAREGAMVAALTPTSFSAGGACDASSNAVTCAATREGQGGFVTVTPADVAMACNPACAKSYGTTVTVTVTGHFQLLTPLLWAFTGGPNVTFSRDATADVIVTPAAAGIPSASPSSSPSASPSPSASASPSPTPSPSPTCAPPYVGFTDKSAGTSGNVSFTSTSTPTKGSCAISFYNWDFGDGSTAAGNNMTTASNKYTGAGPFLVTLAVRTPDGVFTYATTVTP